MFLLDLGQNLITIVLFSVVCGVFGWAIHYLLKSIEYYKQMKVGSVAERPVSDTPDAEPKKEKWRFPFPKLKFPSKAPLPKPKPATPVEEYKPAQQVPKPPTGVSEFKEMLLQQQQYFNDLVRHVQMQEDQSKQKTLGIREEWETKVEQLELQLEEKEEELYQLKKQKEVTEKMAYRLNEVQNEFNLLKDKISELETQASHSNQLSMELEDLKIAFHQLKKESLRKQDKLQDLISENGKLQQLLSDTEDKLQEANMQRQQMQKKISFLEEINADFTRVSEANKKLQNEMRRIGELESLLNMITEERDQLLKRRFQ